MQVSNRQYIFAGSSNVERYPIESKKRSIMLIPPKGGTFLSEYSIGSLTICVISIN